MAEHDPLEARVEEAVRQVRELLNELVGTDPLTGLGNTRAFDLRLTSLKPDTGLGLVAVEANDFKGVNSTYGHKRADVILQEAALRLRAVVEHQSGAQAFRTGGDEFAVVLQNRHATAEATLALGKSARDVIGADPFDVPGAGATTPGEVTVAVTVAWLDRTESPARCLQLWEELDALVEFQKSTDRANEVLCLWDSSHCAGLGEFVASGRSAKRRRFYCESCGSRGHANLTSEASRCPHCGAYFGARMA